MAGVGAGRGAPRGPELPPQVRTPDAPASLPGALAAKAGSLWAPLGRAPGCRRTRRPGGWLLVHTILKVWTAGRAEDPAAAREVGEQAGRALSRVDGASRVRVPGRRLAEGPGRRGSSSSGRSRAGGGPVPRVGPPNRAGEQGRPPGTRPRRQEVRPTPLRCGAAGPRVCLRTEAFPLTPGARRVGRRRALRPRRPQGPRRPSALAGQAAPKSQWGPGWEEPKWRLVPSVHPRLTCYFCPGWLRRGGSCLHLPLPGQRKPPGRTARTPWVKRPSCPVAPSRHSARSAPQKRSGKLAFPATSGRWAKPRQP